MNYESLFIYGGLYCLNVKQQISIEESMSHYFLIKFHH